MRSISYFKAEIVEQRYGFLLAKIEASVHEYINVRHVVKNDAEILGRNVIEIDANEIQVNDRDIFIEYVRNHGYSISLSNDNFYVVTFPRF